MRSRMRFYCQNVTLGAGMRSVPAGPLDGADSNGLQVGVQLPGGVQTGPQQQNQQLLLTPASLQLAQLQAQLTLHRLKLAQGGNTAAAASVLSQVLSNVNMSQPLFNQLRTSPAVGNPQGAFPSGVLGFPSSGSALGALMGGGFNQNPGNVRLNQPCGGSMGQQGGEYAKKSGSAYPSDTDRRLQYNLAGGAAAAPTAGDGQYPAINTPANNMNSVSFQRDFYGQEMQGQPGGFGISEQKVSVYNSAGHKEQWKGHANLTHAGKVDLVSNPAAVWTAAGQPLRSRTDLYNPEEPTSDPKLSCGGGVSSFVSSGAQGFGGYPPLHGSEEILSSGTRTLQPYQVNDFHAVTPAQLPHQCSICDKKVYNLKDWDQHVKGKLHLQNRTLYSNESSAVVPAGAAHYAVGRSSDGGLNAAAGNSMVCSATSQDVSSGANASYLPATAMKTYPMSDAGFAPHQPESKSFPPRKATVGRVVHICNLPEGSCTENDVINLGLPFGKVTNYILMRSTHQAFLEMAYVEAAQAMVQYYQLTPAVINNQKLLIRMSKRYKELQLKKPGKDVQSIIQDITSQRERDEMQELEPYVPERARSRSPISRSLSPHSHSPSFTSCSSAHSPQGAPCRGPERGSNGMGPHRASWDWPSHRRGEEERERDRDDPWRNGSGADDERPNGRASERRKTYQKPSDHLGSRSADERGGGGGDGMRSGRDWHPRSSPQSSSFNSYRNMEDDFFMEHVYKSDKPLRPSYQRHEAKSKRRDGGDYHARSRHSDFEMSEESLCKASEDKRQSSPGRARGKKTSRRHATPERHERNAAESSDRQSKEKSASPHSVCNIKEATESSKDKEIEREWESGDETDEDVWYPNNMEELVTVDEVGGEDDSIIEPDLSELEEFASGPKEPAAEEPGEARVSPSVPSAEVKEECDEKSQAERSCGDAGEPAASSMSEKTEDVLNAGTESQKTSEVAPEPPGTKLGDFPSEEFKAALAETCEEDGKVTDSWPSEELKENHICESEERKSREAGQVVETRDSGVPHSDGCPRKGGLEKTVSPPIDYKVCLPVIEVEAPSTFQEQDKAVSEHSIPLGVEFIVPRTGFFCKLCGLFYTSEEAAKTSHCRSTVHYRNLQKYLSQLAADSLSGALTEPSAAQ
ncbi:RNA-binding protein 20 [Salarias fasciatus]|uniref:RNA-binding protein 20 n=1 Tax=Salarias fasciatus TaxID=181472 RepID=UPI001176852A|nr:RNA-binding protein 20 [Salarias fasciatus]